MNTSQVTRVCLMWFVAVIVLATGPGIVAASGGDSVFPGGVSGGVGWTMAVTGDPFDPANQAPGTEKLDLAPFLQARAVFGDGNGWSLEANTVYANFGRLVNKVDVKQFSSLTSDTEARRALIAELTLKTPFKGGPQGAVALSLLNAGFIFDGQGDSPDIDAMDAAGYLFAGPTFAFVDGKGNAAYADLFIGASEVLTGDEVFNFRQTSQHSVRIRPRFVVQFGGFAGGKHLQVGFWADLGVEDKEPDAATAFVIVPLRP